MTILTRQERERLVLDLYYNQGKTYREIAKEARISPRDIRVILNKVVEEKTKGEEGIKQQDGAEKNQNQEQEQQLSLSTQAYKLFSDRRTPLEVAIALNLRESETTKYYREYWKLKQLHNLNMVYEETRGNIEPFLKLYKLSKAKGMGIKQVVNLLTIANNDLPAIEERVKTLRNDLNMLQFQKHIDDRNLYQLNNKIASTTKLLNSLRMSCIRERREIEKLYNERARLEAIVAQFKNNNEEYIDKIKQAAEEKINEVLTNGKFLLQFAVASVIESLRSNPKLCNFMMYYNSNNTATISYGSNYPSFMSGGQQQHQEQSFNGIYTALILEESEKLYNKLIIQFTSGVITASPTIRESLLSLPSSNNNKT
ncbi:MAG TPA: sigma factor-like helix-turn-helix DNA-binding protein [Nitrososphaeraceae archaeon]|nr:sigma factor-like helix-turn-helix DNA-binding protein [Nitrososphaeraceae archaeon]